MTKITPHKGGRTDRLYVRITPENKRKLEQLASGSAADWIEKMIEEKYPMKSDSEIFDMYANQADPDLLRKMSDEQIASDLREVDPELSQEQAEKYAQAIRRVLDSK